MKRRDKTGGKAAKTQRLKALKRRNSPKNMQRGISLATGEETNVQLTRELAEAREREAATSEVLKVISATPGELEPVFQTMLENATRICEATFGTMLLVEGDAFRRVALHNASPMFADFHSKVPVVQPQKISHLRDLVETKRVVHIADQATVNSDDPITKYAGARTVLIVPLLKENDLIGAFGIYRQEVRPFTDKQIDLVRNFAAQAVIAIENARLLKELRESLQQQTATADVLKVISRSTFDLQTVLNTLVESAAQLCEADLANIWRPKDGAYRLAASYGVTSRYKEYLENKQFLETIGIEPGRGTVVGRTLLEGKTVHVHDVQADPDYKLSGVIGGYRTMLGVPLLRQGVPIGVIVLNQSIVRPFTDKQIELVETFADQAVIAIENVRLFDEVQARTRDLSEALEQQTATSEVLKVISSSPGELKPVFDTMLINAMQVCEAKFGFMHRYEDDNWETMALQCDVPAYAEFVQKARFGPKSIVGRIASTKQVAQVADITATQRYADRDPLAVAAAEIGGVRTILGVPMLKENDVKGAIILYRQEVRPFTNKQIELVQNFAAQAVIAIENTRLLSELRESLQQQTATADVLKVISRSAFDLQTVLDTLVESAAHLCDADCGAIHRPKGGAYPYVAKYGYTPEFDEYMRAHPIIPDEGSVIGRAVAERRVIQISDVLADPEYSRTERQRIGGFRTVLGIPLVRDKTPIGVIVLSRNTVRPFTDKQIELAATFADQAVIAIENVRLFDEVQARTRDLAESLQQQTATADVLKVISRSTFDLRTVLQTLVESAATLCDADKGNITREKDGVFYRAAESYGYSREFVNHIRGLPIESSRGSATGRALFERRVIHIPDVRADPEYTLVDAQRLGDYRSVLAVPMLREGVALGVLTLSRSEVRPFTDKQIELVSTFADQAAIAIENVRLFESVEARTRELAASLENLRATQDRLVQTQKLASLGQLTAGIAHEMKNPLNFVNNFSGLSTELIDELQDTLKGLSFNDKARTQINELTDTLRGNLEKVVQHGKRADAIVKNMLLHSREGSGEHRPVDINAIVEESLNLAYHGARAEKQGFEITLQQSFDPTVGEADVFPQDITRALLNLISNGFYAATKRRTETDSGDYEPTLAASTKNLGDRVEIRIRDNGTGIASDVKEKMFNPFFTTKPTGEGTGLGLSISHDIIVKQHAGSIEVDTEPGAFTEIRIILPRTGVFL